MKRRVGWTGALVLGAVLCGCGMMAEQGPLTESQMEESKLRNVGELYRSYQVMAKKPPRSLKDFVQMGEAGTRGAFSAIRSGEIVVRYQATLPDTEVEPTSTSDEVLAYWKTVPEKGGPVLMLDRRIQHMTAEEFKAARLAGTDEQKSAKPGR
jgi:hypothetical protein